MNIFGAAKAVLRWLSCCFWKVVAFLQSIDGFITALATIAIAAVAGLQWQTFEKTDQTLKATQRPWLSVDLAIAGPLTYSSDEARVEIAFLLKTSGRSPALNVQVDAEIALFIDTGKTPLGVMTEICQRAKAAPDDNPVFGHAIFPNRDFTYVINLGKKKDNVENALKDFPRKEKNDWFAPLIVGCATYRFAFEKGRHMTQFIVELGKINHENPKVHTSFKMSDGDVPASEMSLYRSFIGGNAD